MYLGNRMVVLQFDEMAKLRINLVNVEAQIATQ